MEEKIVWIVEHYHTEVCEVSFTHHLGYFTDEQMALECVKKYLEKFEVVRHENDGVRQEFYIKDTEYVLEYVHVYPMQLNKNLY